MVGAVLHAVGQVAVGCDLGGSLEIEQGDVPVVQSALKTLEGRGLGGGVRVAGGHKGEGTVAQTHHGAGGVHVLYYCAAGEGLEAAVELDEGTLVSEGGLDGVLCGGGFLRKAVRPLLYGGGGVQSAGAERTVGGYVVRKRGVLLE